jgi:biopolymer transport protein ExbD
MQESSSEDRHVNILLRSNGAEIDGKKVSMEELAEALRIFAGKDPEDVIVHVFTTHDAKMGEVLFVQQTMRKMGIRRISYRTFDGKDLPLELPPQKALERFDEMPDAMKIDIVISESSLTVGSREVKFYDLEGVIREKLEETPMAVVVVYFERDANYQDFTGVMAILMAARADRVAVTFVEGE